MNKRRGQKKKWVLYVILLAFLIVASILCYCVWSGCFCNYIGKSDTHKAQKAVDEVDNSEEKPNIVEELSVEDEGEDNKKTIQYDGADPNTSEKLSGSITYAGVLNDRIAIRVNIDQYLSKGDCVLRLLNNGDEIYNKKTSIINSVSTSTCDGFDILFSSVGVGSYEIEIRIASDGKNGVIRGEIEI